jgi:hypothetical protein
MADAGDLVQPLTGRAQPPAPLDGKVLQIDAPEDRRRSLADWLLLRIDDSIVEIFERVTVTAEGVDWDSEGLRGPSSTWTYLVNDNVFGSNTFLTMANRASFGLWSVLLCWWILIPWALVLHWQRRRGKKERGTEISGRVAGG